MSTVRVRRSQCPLSERVVESDSEQSGLSGAGQRCPPSLGHQFQTVAVPVSGFSTHALATPLGKERRREKPREQPSAQTTIHPGTVFVPFLALRRLALLLPFTCSALPLSFFFNPPIQRSGMATTVATFLLSLSAFSNSFFRGASTIFSFVPFLWYRGLAPFVRGENFFFLGYRAFSVSFLLSRGPRKKGMRPGTFVVFFDVRAHQ